MGAGNARGSVVGPVPEVRDFEMDGDPGCGVSSSRLRYLWGQALWSIKVGSGEVNKMQISWRDQRRCKSRPGERNMEG